MNSLMRLNDALFFVGVALATACDQGGVADGAGGAADAATVTDGGASDDSSESTSCGEGQVLCGGVCVDLSSDPQHCGACDASCPGGSNCADGACEPVQCGPGETWCEGSESCEDLTVGPDNCGACGNTCGNGEACIGAACINCDGGACDTACAELGLAYCGGAFGCKDIMNEAAHCGACGRNCFEEFSQVACGYSDVNVDFWCEAGYCVYAETGVPCEPSPEYGICPHFSSYQGYGPDFYCCEALYCEGKCAPCATHHTCIDNECVFQSPCAPGQTPCCNGFEYPTSPDDPPFQCVCCGENEECVPEQQFPDWDVVNTCVPL